MNEEQKPSQEPSTVGSALNEGLGGHRRTKPVKIGGLMRCCLATLDGSEFLKEEEGEVLPCKWCSSSMIFTNGVWGWKRDA